MTALQACAPLEYRRSDTTQRTQLDPRETAVEEVLQLRHEIDDHAVALTLLAGIRPDLPALAIEDAIEELLELARAVHEAHELGRAAWETAIDDYETKLREFAGSGLRVAS